MRALGSWTMLQEGTLGRWWRAKCPWSLAVGMVHILCCAGGHLAPGSPSKFAAALCCEERPVHGKLSSEGAWNLPYNPVKRPCMDALQDKGEKVLAKILCRMSELRNGANTLGPLVRPFCTARCRRCCQYRPIRCMLVDMCEHVW
jgi:hypothetical protein